MPSKQAVDDFTFIMTCWKHSDGGKPKVNFEEVAKEIGAKNANTWYACPAHSHISKIIESSTVHNLADGALLIATTAIGAFSRNGAWLAMVQVPARGVQRLLGRRRLHIKGRELLTTTTATKRAVARSVIMAMRTRRLSTATIVHLRRRPRFLSRRSLLRTARPRSNLTSNNIRTFHDRGTMMCVRMKLELGATLRAYAGRQERLQYVSGAEKV
jgi:hypothetical protein